jgi:hypothetical protein
MNARSINFRIGFGALPLMACLLAGTAAGDELGTYRDDYGKYTPLGNAVTADMKFHAERQSQQAAKAEMRDDARASGEHGDAGNPSQRNAGRAPVATPSLESLTDDSDYSAFMQPGVSVELRREALRRLFRSQKFAAVDELGNDRDDYSDFLPLGDVITADMHFQAGQRMGGTAQLAATHEADQD